MATQAGKAKSAGATKAKAKPAAKPAPPRGGQARSVAQTAVDLPVGAVLEVTDRIVDLVDPFTDRSSAEKQLKTYRTRLRRTVKRTERRGATARRKATTEVRKTRSRVEREARRQQRTLKRNREDVEQRVRRAVEEQTTRAQDLVDQVSEQLSTLR